MNRLRATWAFHRAAAKHRFAEALLAGGQGALGVRGGTFWAQYRLGLYGSVTRRAREEGVGRNPRALLAVAASHAAIGETARAQEYLERLPGASQSHTQWRQRVAGALAPHDPALALKWLEAGAPDDSLAYPDLLTALLIANHQEERARYLVQRALAARLDQAFPELLLHAGNLILDRRLPSDNPRSASLQLLNAYFARHGLEPVERRDEGKPFSVANAASAVGASVAEGPLVSIIVPAYRTADRIVPALESLLRQSYRNLQIIVVDDASEDGLGAPVSEVVLRDRRVEYVRLPRNVGPYVAKELALREKARGEYVTCHDSDDWAHPRRIELQLDALLHDSGRVFCWSQWLRLTDDGHVVARQCHPLLRNNLSSVLFRRRPVLERAGGYDQVRTGADSEFLARLSLVFGSRGGCPIRKPLALGALRAGSLMTDGTTGISGGGTTPFRLDYWEAWRAWHLRCLKAGKSPFMPPPGSQRPFPVSAGQETRSGGDLVASLAGNPVDPAVNQARASG